MSNMKLSDLLPSSPWQVEVLDTEFFGFRDEAFGKGQLYFSRVTDDIPWHTEFFPGKGLMQQLCMEVPEARDSVLRASISSFLQLVCTNPSYQGRAACLQHSHPPGLVEPCLQRHLSMV